MKAINWLSLLLVSAVLCLPGDAIGRGFGGGGRAGGGGGGGGARPSFGGGGGGGGGARPNFGGGGGGQPNFGGGGGGARPNMGGGAGGGNRPSMGNIPNHTPSFSNPVGGGSSRPNFGGGNAGIGNRPSIGGSERPSTLPGQVASRPNPGGMTRPGGGAGGGLGGGGLGGGGDQLRPGNGNRPGLGGGGEQSRPGINNRPGLGGGGDQLRPGNGNRPGLGGGGEQSRPGINNRPGLGGGGDQLRPGNGNRPGQGGDRTNIGQIGNNNININHNNVNNNFNNFNQNNFNHASTRPYYNNWQHGNWNGNWNRPGGGGYANGWAHGYAHGYMNGGWGGYWHGGYGGYWGRPWYASPVAWGLGAWTVGSIMYNSGYASYSNPYYVAGTGTTNYYDYSQPITVVNPQTDPGQTVIEPGTQATQASPTPSPEVQEGTSHMDLARDAFKNGDYTTATSEINLAIKALPNDAALHEFRALVFFATQDYKQAAGTLYAVLSAGPGWDWTTLSGMYANVATYTEQLRSLEQYVKDNPGSADARFVLAYQYLTCGYSDSAKKQYIEVLKIQPSDQLSAQLLKLLGGDPSTETASTPTPQPPDPNAPSTPDAPPAAATPTEEEPKAPATIDATKLIGNWTAKRPDGASFSLNLTTDSKFTWGFDQGGKKQEFGGKYSVDGAILVLERTDGQQMPGLITLADNGFNFKLYGGPPDDTGLDFKK